MITKADILEVVNEAFAQSYSGSNLDVPIKMALDDLSRMHVLKAEDTTQTLTSSSDYLTYPSDALYTDQAIISVVLTDSNGNRQNPLYRLRGGWTRYNEMMSYANASSRSYPAYMVTKDRKIYLWPPPSGNYTSSIWYYKLHQDIDSGVEFDDEWKNAICYGTIFFKAKLMASSEYLSLWQPEYLQEKERMRISIPRDLSME